MSFHKILLLFILILSSITVFGQNKIAIYNPDANAKRDLDSAIVKATNENKHIFVQIGGNWCPWCVLMHEFYSQDTEIDSIMNTDYVPILVNYSRENKNLDLMKKFEFPQRFGFPVIVILDGEGNRIHTQNTVCLEEGRGYNPKKFLKFLYNWSPAALNSKNYKK